MMKQFTAICLLILVLTSCTKKDNSISHTNCDGVLTDTSGTGDTARIYMPNAFTPNNDGLNDIIKPFTKSIQSINFIVYDGNNNEVFSTNQSGTGWPGLSTANSGSIYYYKIKTVTLQNHHIDKCGAFLQLSCLPPKTPDLYFEDQITANGFTAVTGESLPNCP
ncbi:hypothetical protein BH11BAC4_BH11BAC4_24200 [soil metagenome]